MHGLKRVVAEQPTLLGVAIRVTLVAVIAFGVEMTTEQVGAIVIAVEAWLAVVQYALTTPEVRARRREEAAAEAAALATKVEVEEGVRQLAAAAVADDEEVEAALVTSDDPPRLRPRIGPP